MLNWLEFRLLNDAYAEKFGDFIGTMCNTPPNVGIECKYSSILEERCSVRRWRSERCNNIKYLPRFPQERLSILLAIPGLLLRLSTG